MLERRVIKVGTSLLRGTPGRDTRQVIADLARNIAIDYNRRNWITLVTSGAVGLGCDRLGLEGRPSEVIALQAAASVGQGRLIGLYDTAFSEYNIRVSQILLNRHDLSLHERYKNSIRTLHQVLDWGVIPIINENDTVTTDELKFGDNDSLSALVAIAIQAHELILLTDVSQLYSSDPKKDSNATPIKVVRDLIELDKLQISAGGGSEWGTGGMMTKLAAARMATAGGIRVRLADGRDPAVLEAILRGEDRGTLFEAPKDLFTHKKAWIAYAFQMKGVLTVNASTEKALVEDNASLMIGGILSTEGDFEGRNTVKVLNINGDEVCRGILELGKKEINDFISKRNNCEEGVSQISPQTVVITQEKLILSKDIPVY
uniref:Gamma-glutamyl kinase n=1 Tax=Paulinella longichromatophora TaxID=1708747 RepID=A0A2H4ZP12_9EUKA|nr:gamma-glutamyl kinase [Paulinella longichromatophora]